MRGISALQKELEDWAGRIEKLESRKDELETIIREWDANPPEIEGYPPLEIEDRQGKNVNVGHLPPGDEDFPTQEKEVERLQIRLASERRQFKRIREIFQKMTKAPRKGFEANELRDTIVRSIRWIYPSAKEEGTLDITTCSVLDDIGFEIPKEWQHDSATGWEDAFVKFPEKVQPYLSKRRRL